MKNIKRMNKCSKRLSIWDENKSKFVAIGAEDGIGGRFCGYEDELTLDETFDSGAVKFMESRASKPLKPLTPLRIEYAENDGVHNDDTYSPSKEGYVTTEYWLSSTSRVVQDTCFSDRPNTYTHNIDMIEPTYLLTTAICDTLTFTNKLGHAFKENAELLEPIKYSNLSDEENKKLFDKFELLKSYNNIYSVNDKTLHIYSYDELIALKHGPALPGDRVYISDKKVAIYIDGVMIGTNITSVDIKGSVIRIEYSGKYTESWSSPGSGGPNVNYSNEPFTYIYEIGVLENIKNKPFYTISNVLNRIVEVGVTRRKGEKQRYKIDSKVLEKYKDVRAPEFHITRNTLFEALLQVGDYIHAIPRLLWNEEDNAFNLITFDELGGDEEWKPSECDILTGCKKTRYVQESYGAYDSVVQNLINTTNEAEASVKSISRTPRVERGNWAIANDTACITVDKPFYRVLKLEVAKYENEKFITKDITPYLYEEAEYETLSSYTDAYPYAKSYALTYRQGGNVINGFAFQRETCSNNIKIPNCSLQNILKKEGLTGMDNNFKDLIFTVTYIPIVEARVVQKKAYKGDFDLNCSVIYNQQSNTVESNYYGENVKGILAMLGNEVTFMRYKVFDFNNLPRCGQKIGDNYIFNIKRNIMCNDSIEYSMLLTENFNKLNDYYGLHSNFRLFDVSEKQSINREINYSEELFLGFKQKKIKSNFALKEVGNMIKNTLLSEESNNLCAIAQGFDKDNIAIQKPVIKSLVSGSMGNSIFFNYKYDDNFSAGEKVEDAFIMDNNNKYSQKLVPYGDVYGELYYLKLHILKNKDSANLDEAKNAPECEYDFTNTNNVVFDYATDPLVIRKDSRECLNVTTQINFVAEDKEIVIGRLLCLRNSLVNMNANYPTPKLVLLPYKVNMLNSYLDLTNAWAVKDLDKFDFKATEKEGIIGVSPNATFMLPSGREPYKSWAIVDTATGEYYLAVNNDKGISSSADIKAVYFNY